MPNLVQSRDAHTATDHSVTRERAIEIQRLVYKSRIKDIKYQDAGNALGVECDRDLFQNYKKKKCHNVYVLVLLQIVKYSHYSRTALQMQK